MNRISGTVMIAGRRAAFSSARIMRSWRNSADSTRSAEAGLTVDAAFNRVSKELGKAYPELGDEFGLTAIELGFLSERRQAFENLANRVDLEAVRGVVTTMIQTEKYGTPLASALRVLSAEFRHQRMMRAEEKAARLPAIMTVPLILFILPTLFVVILGPASCSINDSFLHGNH
jgi:tight adherence protein C